MRVVVAVVGKPRDANLAGAIREYEARAARYWPLDVREVREESAADVSADRRARREGERLLDAVPPAAQVVACDVSGRRVHVGAVRRVAAASARARAGRGVRDRRRVRARRRRSRAARRSSALARAVDAAARARAPRARRTAVSRRDDRPARALSQVSVGRAGVRMNRARGSHRIARRVRRSRVAARAGRVPRLVPGAATRRAAGGGAHARDVAGDVGCRLARRALAGVRRERRRGEAAGAQRERTGASSSRRGSSRACSAVRS